MTVETMQTMRPPTDESDAVQQPDRLAKSVRHSLVVYVACVCAGKPDREPLIEHHNNRRLITSGLFNAGARTYARVVMDLDCLLHVSLDVDGCGDVERDVHLYVNSSTLNLDVDLEMDIDL